MVCISFAEENYPKKYKYSTFSVEYFQKAISSDWCLKHNSSMRGRCTREQGFDLYENDKFKDNLAYTIDSGILLDLDHYGPHVSNLRSRLTAC